MQAIRNCRAFTNFTATIQYVRKGQKEIPLHLIIILARYYRVSLDYITGLTNDKRGVGYKDETNSKYNITQNNSPKAVIKIKEEK